MPKLTLTSAQRPADLEDLLWVLVHGGKNPTVCRDHRGEGLVLFEGQVPDVTIERGLRHDDLPNFIPRFDPVGSAQECLASIVDRDADEAQRKAIEDRIHERWRRCPACGSYQAHYGGGKRSCTNNYCGQP